MKRSVNLHARRIIDEEEKVNLGTETPLFG